MVPQSNGLGNAMLGFMLGRSLSGNHANNGYPAGTVNNAGVSQGSAAGVPSAAPEASFGASMLRTFAWLLVLGTLGWLCYFGWKFFRRTKAPSTANYSFERE